MSKRGFFMYWFTPFGRMRDAANSLGDAVKDSKSKLKPPRVVDLDDLDERDVRRITDAKERFEVMYAMHQWTPAELANQKKALKAGKVTALAMAAFVFIVSLGLIAVASPMVHLFAMPLGIFLTILSLAQSFRYALFETQVELRAFIDARAFLSMPDFWRRLLG
jgi:hypothetical protein